MAFEFGTQFQQVRQLLWLPKQRVGRQQPGSGCGRAGPDAAARRNALYATDAQPARELLADFVINASHGLDNAVGLVVGQRFGAFAADLQDKTVARHLNAGFIPQVEGQAEAIEGRAQVGSAGGDANGDAHCDQSQGRLCFSSPGLYVRRLKADQASFTAIRFTNLRSTPFKLSQPLSRVRSVCIFADPFGKLIQMRDSGPMALSTLGSSLSNSALFLTKSWIQSNFPLNSWRSSTSLGKGFSEFK